MKIINASSLMKFMYVDLEEIMQEDKVITCRRLRMFPQKIQVQGIWNLHCVIVCREFLLLGFV